ARNTTGEVLDGGTGADLLLEADTLQLAQNVNLRNITLSNFEILDLQSYNGYLNLSQLGSNSFQTIKGSGNFYLYGTSSDDNLDFGTIDFSGFSGNMYVYGYGGDDIYNFENATLGTDATFYLDASSGTDTLKLGANQTLNMTDNYYNTFEKFDIGADSTLNVNALNNNGRSFYAHNKDFDNISADDGLINFIGGSGDDIFYVDYTALEAGKLSIDGKGGADRVDIRAFTGDVDFTNVGDSNLFSNIETLDIDQAGSYDVNLSADVLAAWIDGSNLTLDIANNAQGSKITITGAEGGDITNLTLGSSYSIVSADDPSLSFTMAVV
ncbi:hypothetical protein, partial [Sulfurimonas sp.]|uniref:hypothetical protein n=1 Tax=Sulfurimonas sp. TaxID=2022749 RepID=UPI0025D048A7